MSMEEKETVFQFHGNNIIFETLIYPYFEQSTLLKIKGAFLSEFDI